MSSTKVQVPALCCTCGAVRTMARTGAWWKGLRCTRCKVVTTHACVDVGGESYGTWYDHALADNRAFNRLLDDLAGRGVDVRWAHDEALDDPLAWAAEGIPGVPPGGESLLELHQYRDGERTWFKLVIDARVARDRLLDRLKRAADAIDAPDRWPVPWVARDGYDWRGGAMGRRC
ncbi:hypothetical protein [Nocardioides sp.]|uniref:hypothetical protein n=1 Tax=Nocardioides sp. TaxID=35761 RepID=UPI00261DF471|nr:hypothetical protein [Nocardioides sp.]MDI6912196.1 hypothetical protein [Nocardioides sp.]